MLALAVNALYATLRRRGTSRQLTAVIVACTFSALLLLPAIVWYNARFIFEGAVLSSFEIEIALGYVALWGWLVPLGITASYIIFTEPRRSRDSAHLRSLLQGYSGSNDASRQSGVPAPFVFGEDIPWGWLEHRSGRFQGQRLALKRGVIKIGREEDNEIWLDDDAASRYHAELTWNQGIVHVIDLGSLNGVLLNGRPVRGAAIVKHGSVLEIGEHRFLFEYAEPPHSLAGQDDPLLRHGRIAPASIEDSPTSTTKSLEDGSNHTTDTYATVATDLPPTLPTETASELWQETAQLSAVPQSTAQQASRQQGAFIIRSGEMAGRGFVLDRPVVTIGRDIESDLIINDPSISRRHAQVLRQVNGDYVQDLASRNGTKVNDELLNAPRLLQSGDIVCLGDVRLEYTSAAMMRTTPFPPLPLSSRARSFTGPLPLRLPSKPKKE